MKKFKFIGLMVLMASLSFNAKSQTDTTYNFSLKEAQSFAIENYYETVNAKKDIEKAEKVIWETTAIGLPQVNAEAAYQHIPGEIPELSLGMDSLFNYIFGSLAQLGYPPDPDLMGGDSEGGNEISPKNSITYSVTVSQLIFSGEYIVGLQASRVYKSLSEESYEKTIINVKENIAGTYYGILVLENNLESLNKTIGNAQLTLKHTKGFYEQGLVEETDVKQLELIVNNTKNGLNSIERQINTMHALLNYQLGLPADAQVNLKENMDDLIAINMINPEQFKFDLESNIDYKMLETQEKLMKLDLDRYKSKYLPTVAAFYQYSDKTNKTAVDFTINHVIGVSMNVPIFTSGQRMAVVAQSRIDYEKALNVKEQQTEMLKIAAKQAKGNYLSAVEKYENEKQSLQIAEKIFNDTNEKFKQGMVSSIDLAMANNQFLTTQISYSAAIQELFTAKIALDKSYNNL